MARGQQDFYQWTKDGNDQNKIDFAAEYLKKSGVNLSRLYPDSRQAIFAWGKYIQPGDDHHKLFIKMRKCWNTKQCRKAQYGTTYYRFRMKTGLRSVLDELSRKTGRSVEEALELLITDFDKVRKRARTAAEKEVKTKVDAYDKLVKRPSANTKKLLNDQLDKLNRELKSLQDIADRRLWDLCRFTVVTEEIVLREPLSDDLEKKVRVMYLSKKGIHEQEQKKCGSEYSEGNPTADQISGFKPTKNTWSDNKFKEVQSEINEAVKSSSQAGPPVIAHKSQTPNPTSEAINSLDNSSDDDIYQDSCKTDIDNPQSVETKWTDVYSKITSTEHRLPKFYVKAKNDYLSNQPSSTSKRYSAIEDPIELPQDIRGKRLESLQSQMGALRSAIYQQMPFKMELLDQICWRIAIEEGEDSDRVLRANMHKDVFLQGWLGDRN